MFVRFNATDRISVISTPGVLRLLGDQSWDMVRDEELVQIRTGLANGLPLRPYGGLSVGTKVRVRNGVFAGVEGVVTELRKQCRVIITLAAVRQCFSLEAGIDELDVSEQARAQAGTRPDACLRLLNELNGAVRSHSIAM